MSDMLDAALEYAALGWPALPLRPRGKVPAGNLVPHDCKDATTDIATIRSWWRQLPTANVGLATGYAFDVLDVDGPEGMAALDTALPLAERPEDDPTIDGPTAETRGGGAHVYVAATGAGNRTGMVPKVDWRGQGGYVVAPPSVHPTGYSYVWACGKDDPDYGLSAPIRKAPAWLLELLGPQRRLVGSPTGAEVRTHDLSAYGQGALRDEVERLRNAPVGQRNDTLNRAAFAIGQLIGGGVLSPKAADHLLAAALVAGLGEKEADETLASGLLAGADKPRRVA